MSDTTDDMESLSGFCDDEYDEYDEYDELDLLKNKTESLEKIIYGLNIKLNNLERKIRVIEIELKKVST